MHTLSVTRALALLSFPLFVSSCSDKQNEPAKNETTSAPHEESTAEKTIPSGLKFPANYKETFTNYLNLDRVQNPDQIIRLFSNEIASQGPDANGKFPFGSVIVAEIYKAKKNANGEVITSSLGRRIKGEMALIAVMERQKSFTPSENPALANEHWDFAAFKPDGSVAPKNLNSCRSCHAPLTNRNHLFSFEHLGGVIKK